MEDTASKNTILFRKWNCIIHVSEYLANRKNKSIHLLDAITYEPICTATIWLPGLSEKEVAIKNYSENEGLYDVLVKANIIEPAHREIPSGYITALICNLKSKLEWDTI